MDLYKSLQVCAHPKNSRGSNIILSAPVSTFITTLNPKPYTPTLLRDRKKERLKKNPKLHLRRLFRQPCNMPCLYVPVASWTLIKPCLPRACVRVETTAGEYNILDQLTVFWGCCSPRTGLSEGFSPNKMDYKVRFRVLRGRGLGFILKNWAVEGQ